MAGDESPRWHAGALNNGLVFSATYHGVCLLPRQVSYAIGHVGTWLAYHLIRDGTDALLDNLRQVFPSRPHAELQRLALLTYRSYARDTIDFIRSLSMDRRPIARLLRDYEWRPFDRVLAGGKGALLVTGHFGNWEFGGVALRRLCDYPVAVVGRPEPSPIVNRIRHQIRQSLQIDTIAVRQHLDTALQIRRRLANNEIIAFLVDRHLGKDRIDVEFLGRRAQFLRTPALLGFLTGAPLVPSYMLRQPGGWFHGFAEEPIYVDRGQDRDTAVQQATQRFASSLEAQIRRHPHLWYQFYRYWED
jgi:KDO2-lipid IV(A) lauroyltransferase